MKRRGRAGEREGRGQGGERERRREGKGEKQKEEEEAGRKQGKLTLEAAAGGPL